MNARTLIGAGLGTVVVASAVSAVLLEGMKAREAEALSVERLRGHVIRVMGHVADNRGDMPQTLKGDRLDLAPPGADDARPTTILLNQQHVGLWPATLREWWAPAPTHPELFSPGLLKDGAADWDLATPMLSAVGVGGWPSYQWEARIIRDERKTLGDFWTPARTRILHDASVAYLPEARRADRRSGAHADGTVVVLSDEAWQERYDSVRRFFEGEPVRR
jgi:hypothetical protein